MAFQLCHREHPASSRFPFFLREYHCIHDCKQFRRSGRDSAERPVRPRADSAADVFRRAVSGTVLAHEKCRRGRKGEKKECENG